MSEMGACKEREFSPRLFAFAPRIPLFLKTMANLFPSLLLAIGMKKMIAGVGVLVIGIGAAVYFLVIKKK